VEEESKQDQLLIRGSTATPCDSPGLQAGSLHNGNDRPADTGLIADYPINSGTTWPCTSVSR
jgi:hypothetical protein